MSSHHRREAEAARRFREETRTIAKEHGFPQYIAITSGIGARREIGMYVGLPSAFNTQAEQQLAGGQVAAALESTNEAWLWIEKNGERAHECHIRCCRGDIFRALNEPERACAEYHAGIAAATDSKENFGSFVPLPNLRVSGAIRVSGMRLASCWLRSTAGLLKGSTHSI